MTEPMSQDRVDRHLALPMQSAQEGDAGAYTTLLDEAAVLVRQAVRRTMEKDAMSQDAMKKDEKKDMMKKDDMKK